MVQRLGAFLIVVTSVVIGGCAASTHGRSGPAPDVRSELVLEVRLGDRRQDRVVRVRLEDYVLGVVVGESWMPDEPDAVRLRMYKLQAILARTYAVFNLRRHAKEGFHLCSTTHCQLYRPRLADTARTRLARAAVAETRGHLLVHERTGRPAETLFHSSCGGHTSSAESVWGGRTSPHLRPVRDDFCVLQPHVDWRFDVDRGRLSNALNGDRRTRVGGAVRSLEIVDRDEAGRAARVRIAGRRTVEVTGVALRQVLTRAFGVRSIRSTRMNVISRGGTVVFHGAGFGHGVGLCQNGALVQARQGRSAVEILRFYYANVRVEPRPRVLLTD